MFFSSRSSSSSHRPACCSVPQDDTESNTTLHMPPPFLSIDGSCVFFFCFCFLVGVKPCSLLQDTHTTNQHTVTHILPFPLLFFCCCAKPAQDAYKTSHNTIVQPLAYPAVYRDRASSSCCCFLCVAANLLLLLTTRTFHTSHCLTRLCLFFCFFVLVHVALNLSLLVGT